MRIEIGLVASLIVSLFLFQGCQKDDLVDRNSSNSSIDLRQGQGKGFVGYVYSMDNNADSNNLLVFTRDVHGNLEGPEAYATGGEGTGDGLGSQGSVVTAEQWVLAVNAGSNQISVFNTEGKTIELVEVDSSYGEMPVSIAVFDTLVYVLNAGGDGNIAGFAVNDTVALTFIEGSQQMLSGAGVGPAQISFSQDGEYLVVTEKMTNMITTYPVDDFGVAGPGTSYPSAGETPFGFDFGHNNLFVVSEAAGGAEGASTLTSYRLEADGSITVLDGPDSTGQSAACWVVLTNNAKYAYATNTGSANITGVSLDPHGTIELLDEDGIAAESEEGPIDAALSRNSKILYVLNGESNSITIYSVDNRGGLEQLGVIDGLPESIVGLAAE